MYFVKLVYYGIKIEGMVYSWILHESFIKAVFIKEHICCAGYTLDLVARKKWSLYGKKK